jgi:hypothetical protein
MRGGGGAVKWTQSHVHVMSMSPVGQPVSEIDFLKSFVTAN